MSNDPPKRRWNQFSLLTLLIVTLLLCVGFAGIGWRMQRARDNRARLAVVEDALKKLGGLHNGHYEERRPQTWIEKQFDDPGDSDDPVMVRTVTVVILFADLDDTTIEHLKKLPDVVSLGVESRATDAGLERLKGMTYLETLYLRGAQVTDEGLEHLKGMTNLQSLNLRHTSVTDEGAKNFRQVLPNCRVRLGRWRAFPPIVIK
jgi:hypothetical protein